MDSNQKVSDVIIVGAGLAGLAAAQVINQTELNYTVLEASDRAGGKVHSGPNSEGEFWLELGAQFVNTDMTEMVRFIEESGLSLVETTSHPDSVFLHAKTMKPVGELIASVDEDLLGEVNSTELSLSDVIEELTDTEDEAAVVKSFIAEETTVDTQYLSAEGYIDTSERYTSEQDDLTHQASGSLSHVINHLVDSLNVPVQFNQAVRKIKAVGDHYELTTDAGDIFQSRRVILAVPPTVARKISLSKELNTHFEPLLSSFVDGSVIKVTLSYDEAFWKTVEGKENKVPLEGIVYSRFQGMTVSDSSKEGDTPRLTAFIGGDLAKELAAQTPDERCDFVMERLKEVLGVKASDYLDYRESLWVNHPFCGGGYSAQVNLAGEADAPEQLRQPYKRLIFASTELAESFPGFMEGAVRSGKQAAEKVILMFEKG